MSEKETLQQYLRRKATLSEGGCWKWPGDDRYGTAEYEGRSWGAHRASYEAFVGPIPTGLIVRHTCDNRACINPAHLVLGTHTDNRRDFFKRHPKASQICATSAQKLVEFRKSLSEEERAELNKRTGFAAKVAKLANKRAQLTGQNSPASEDRP